MIAISVASICKDFFPIGYHVDQLIASNPEIRPVATWIGSINPYNFCCLNANANFIPESSCLELMGEPLGIKGDQFLNATISSINCDATDTSIILLLPVLKVNLVVNEAIVLEKLSATWFSIHINLHNQGQQFLQSESSSISGVSFHHCWLKRLQDRQADRLSFN